MTTKPAKVILVVTAGVTDGDPIPELTKRWALTAEQYSDTFEYYQALAGAVTYATSLTNPAKVNWVNWEWCWL